MPAWKVKPELTVINHNGAEDFNFFFYLTISPPVSECIQPGGGRGAGDWPLSLPLCWTAPLKMELSIIRRLPDSWEATSVVSEGPEQWLFWLHTCVFYFCWVNPLIKFTMKPKGDAQTVHWTGWTSYDEARQSLRLCKLFSRIIPTPNWYFCSPELFRTRLTVRYTFLKTFWK